jgi:hypothetical protein
LAHRSGSLAVAAPAYEQWLHDDKSVLTDVLDRSLDVLQIRV